MARKVLMIVENLPVPKDRRVWQEACALRDAGWGVSIICPGSKLGHEVLEGVDIWHHPLPPEGEGPLGYLREYVTALAWQTLLAWRVLFAKGFDVIHVCNPPEIMFVIGLMFKVLGKKFIFDHHDLSPELYVAKFGHKGWLYRLVLLLEHLTYRTADVAISTNDTFRRVAVLRGGMAAGRVFVVRSAPDMRRLRILPPDPSLKHGAAHLVAYVGVMNSQDGVEYVLEAMRHIIVEKGRKDVRAVLMGDGPRLPALKCMAPDFGIESHVDFTGWADDSVMIPMLNAADVCISPDPVNAFNHSCTMNKIMEYMALAKPVVMFNLNEGRYSAGDAALYARDDDAADLADKILELINDPDKARHMGEIGKARMDQDLAWDYQVPKLLAAYEAAFRKG